MTLRPYALHCDHRTTPLGTEANHPLLGWKLAATNPGLRPVAYRLEVVPLGNDGQPGHAAWSDGWRKGAGSLGAVYAGEPLLPMTRYQWSVQVLDQHGGESEPVSSWFETGLMAPGAWRARWIARGSFRRQASPPNGRWRSRFTAYLAPPCQFRKELDLRTPTRWARAYVAARGLYQLRINGERVGHDELVPGWTDYRHRIMYQAYDVTDLLSAGRNVVTAVVADGWWCGYIGFDPRQQARHYGHAPALLAQLVVEQADSERLVVATDPTWAEHPGEALYADLLMGEAQDWRLSTPGWDRAGFDASQWAPAAVLDDTTDCVTASTDEPVRVVEEVPGRAVSRDGENFIVDFGQNLVGRLRVRVPDDEAGRRVVFRHGEMLDDGKLYTANLRTAEATDVVITSGAGGNRTFEPNFTCHGFRYAEVSGYRDELQKEDISARVLQNDMATVGELHCSDDMVERLISNIHWGQRGNFVAVPTDCPQRDERFGWTADAQIFLPTACYFADVAAFMGRWLEDLVAAQDADGAFPDIAPVLPSAPRPEAAPAWGDAGVIVPYHLWRVYGDQRILQRYWPAMSAWVDHIERHNPGLIWRHATGHNFGDWLQVGVETPRDLLATAYFARSATLVSKAAEALGQTGEARRYAELAGRVGDAFAAEFVRPDGTVGEGTQTSYLMALAFGLVPPQLVDASFSRLCADIEARGDRLTTGFVGAPLLCPVLTDFGRPDLAFRLLHQKEFPSWGYSVRHGATTIWERWDGWTEEEGFQTPQMNSFNHYAFGAVGAWLWEHVAGISQSEESVAYTDLVIAPHFDPAMEWVSARYDSPRGLIAVRWERGDHAVHLDLEIPPGNPAELRLRGAADATEVLVDGEAATEHSWTRALAAGPDATVRLALAPGSWKVFFRVHT